MSLNRSQKIALNLAGTVALPTPFPSTAEILATADGKLAARLASLRAKGARAASALDRLIDGVILKVVHVISPRLTITRLVPVGEVRAVFVPDDTGSVSHSRGRWYLPPDLEAEAAEAVTGRFHGVGREPSVEVPIFPRPGIVYLAESARVLMEVGVSLTAAESVEYYPPLPHDRTHDFRDFCEQNKKWQEST